MDRIEPDGISWAPARQVFLRRVGVTAALTFLGLTLVTLGFAVFSGLPVGWSILVSLILTLGFVIEDLLRWRGARSDMWQIAGGQLTHDGADGRSVVPLTDIARAETLWGSRVRVTLTSGQRIIMRYLPHPEQTAAAIRAAGLPQDR